jgi:hypothetical protein
MSGIRHLGAGYTRQRVVTEIAENGLWPYSLHAPAGSTYPYHHHDTDETIYVIEGELLFTEEQTARPHTIKTGEKMIVDAACGHTTRALSDTTYIMGLKDFIPLQEFAVWHEPASPEAFFKALAQQFADAEQYPSQPRDYSSTLSRQLPRTPETGEQFYKRILSDRLQFRRAGGPPPVDKATFLRGLTNPDNRTDAIAIADVEVIEYSRDVVLVSLIVTLTGRRGGNEIKGGRYRNFRVFAREPGEWRCVLWFNNPA